MVTNENDPNPPNQILENLSKNIKQKKEKRMNRQANGSCMQLQTLPVYDDREEPQADNLSARISNMTKVLHNKRRSSAMNQP